MLEPAEVARWERLTDAMLRHAAADDPEAFAQVVAVLERATSRLPDVAQHLTCRYSETFGVVTGDYSWQDLANALGVSRQAAWRKYTRPRMVTRG